MYKVKPIQEKLIITELPTVMYKTKCYFNENDLNFDDDDNECSLSSQMSQLNLDPAQLEDLTKQQNKQFRRLERLFIKSNELCEDLKLDKLVVNTSNFFTNKKSCSYDQAKLKEIFDKQEAQFREINKLGQRLNQICEELNLKSLMIDLKKLTLNDKSSSLNQSKQPIKVERKKLQVDLNLFKDIKRSQTKANNNKSIVDDLVIHLDPQHVPLDLFNYFDLLTTTFKCFIKFHVHGSVSTELVTNSNLDNKIQNINDLFESLKLGVNESRNNYDFGFTFIWKKLSEGVEPQLRSTDGSMIAGEAKIIEKINTILPEANKISNDKLKSHQNSSQLLKVLKSL